MKRIIYILLCITLVISCQKADDNGDLGGWWKLMQIEEIENDTIIDKSNEDCFWAIQLEMITTNNGGKGRFQHIGDSLFVQMIQLTEELPEDAVSGHVKVLAIHTICDALGDDVGGVNRHHGEHTLLHTGSLGHDSAVHLGNGGCFEVWLFFGLLTHDIRRAGTHPNVCAGKKQVFFRLRVKNIRMSLTW